MRLRARELAREREERRFIVRRCEEIRCGVRRERVIPYTQALVRRQDDPLSAFRFRIRSDGDRGDWRSIALDACDDAGRGEVRYVDPGRVEGRQ